MRTLEAIKFQFKIGKNRLFRATLINYLGLFIELRIRAGIRFVLPLFHFYSISNRNVYVSVADANLIVNCIILLKIRKIRISLKIFGTEFLPTFTIENIPQFIHTHTLKHFSKSGPHPQMKWNEILMKICYVHKSSAIKRF